MFWIVIILCALDLGKWCTQFVKFKIWRWQRNKQHRKRTYLLSKSCCTGMVEDRCCCCLQGNEDFTSSVCMICQSIDSSRSAIIAELLLIIAIIHVRAGSAGASSPKHGIPHVGRKWWPSALGNLRTNRFCNAFVCSTAIICTYTYGPRRLHAVLAWCGHYRQYVAPRVCILEEFQNLNAAYSIVFEVFTNWQLIITGIYFWRREIETRNSNDNLL